MKRVLLLAGIALLSQNTLSMAAERFESCYQPYHDCPRHFRCAYSNGLYEYPDGYYCFKHCWSDNDCEGNWGCVRTEREGHVCLPPQAY